MIQRHSSRSADLWPLISSRLVFQLIWLRLLSFSTFLETYKHPSSDDHVQTSDVNWKNLNRSENGFKLIKEGFLKDFLSVFFFKILSVLLEDMQHQQICGVVKRSSYNSRSIYRYVNSGCTSGNDKSSLNSLQTLECELCKAFFFYIYI